jgi:threonyl-tRNA synthetase
VQVRVLPVAQAHEEYAAEVVAQLRAVGARVDTAVADDGLGKRIRNAKLEKLPYVLVVGDDDVAARTIGVNPRGGEVERNVDLASFVTQFQAEVENAESAALDA